MFYAVLTKIVSNYHQILPLIYSSGLIDSFNNKTAMTALGRSSEYHWNQIISKSVQRFSRRSRLKIFSIYSPGGHFVQQSGTV